MGIRETDNYYKAIETYADGLKKRIAYLEKKQTGLPQENLKITRRGNCICYFARGKAPKREIKYIPKTQKERIEQLVNADYVRKVLPKLRRNYNAACEFLKLHSGIEETEIAESMPLELQRLNSKYHPCKADYIAHWLKAPYRRNDYMTESLVHPTLRGEMMRSKSEAMIANSLYNHKLAYLLEVPLLITQTMETIYPDFVILHPQTLKKIYWEHFGMMGDPMYAAGACKRIQLLDREGIKMGVNLICTFESSDSPLSSVLVESYIKQYF